ncbi:unnamed protein product [Amoebophrya sp. A25]|nr:unnamed protein product [Amoebophrya sp. A25]|eukprot:GSA25T00000533001.1
MHSLNTSSVMLLLFVISVISRRVRLLKDCSRLHACYKKTSNY